MEAYTAFAKVYDLFMEDVPYDVWCEDIVRILHTFGIDDGIVCDMGCGTGQLTRRLAGKGFDMIGIDLSAEMLGEAMAQESEGILYLQQDLRSFELYGTVRAFVSYCNTMNYLLTEEDLVTALRLVNNYLDPGGIFLFDLHTDAYYRAIGDETIAEDRDEAGFIWENSYDEETGINQYDMVFYIEEDAEEELFRRYTEQHLQRGYGTEDIRKAAAAAGMDLLWIRDAETGNDADEDSTTMLIALRERGKENKNV